MQVIWTRAAVREAQHVHDYLADFNPKAAIRVAEALYKAGDSLAHFPLIMSYPYIIRYRVSGVEVVILRVRHSSRRPAER